MIFMWAGGSTRREMDTVSKSGQMAPSIQETGKMIKCMDMARSNTATEMFMKEMYKREKLMDTEKLHMLMAVIMKETGIMIPNMAKDYTRTLMGLYTKVAMTTINEQAMEFSLI
eukprot:CAMPEP_0116885448 /NCGR_PEP_ID=MMETSP0463-20121206/18796_1 /TAXON_ID=181622 /ORGANISM="Strombidinopsis sp, Strain SopsisLIS2011" /LENGTH=113 /DNA_ID=CAMNT_0004543875 /DNA_START=399 /DNA_END=740 /DNA_ORIENTATION=+